jgi:hypothetical protein
VAMRPVHLVHVRDFLLGPADKALRAVRAHSVSRTIPTSTAPGRGFIRANDARMSPTTSPTPATRMRPHSGKSEQTVHEPEHQTLGIRNATVTAVTNTAAPAPSSIFGLCSGMTMAAATMTASTAIATGIHLHFVSLTMMTQVTPPQMPVPASIAAAAHFTSHKENAACERYLGGTGPRDLRALVVWVERPGPRECCARFPAFGLSCLCTSHRDGGAG